MVAVPVLPGPPLAVFFARVHPGAILGHPPHRLLRALETARDRGAMADPRVHLVVGRPGAPPSWTGALDGPVVEVTAFSLYQRLRPGALRRQAAFLLARVEACRLSGRPVPVCFRPEDAPGLAVVYAGAAASIARRTARA